MLWQQVAADESSWDIAPERWTFFPTPTCDLGAASSQPVPLRIGKVFRLSVASAVKLKF